jgi:hypothetical protein
MEERGYFSEGKGCAPGAETVLEPYNDEAIVYEDFFNTGLCMPPHPALVDILLYFQAQLHQLMPNTSAQLSKKFGQSAASVACLWGICLRNITSYIIS